MIDEDAARELKGKVCKVNGVKLTCADIRRLGGIWHGWMYAADLPIGGSWAQGFMPLHLCGEFKRRDEA